MLLTVVFGAMLAVARLEAHVDRRIREHIAHPSISLVDLPEGLDELARADLHNSVSELLARDWMDASLCQRTAARLATVGWVAKVNFVRRTGDGLFDISCRYRLPEAMVQQGGEFLLIDGEGTRLPGTYLYDPAWKLIQGVKRPAPAPGVKWEGDDLQAGLAIITALEQEPFAEQITAVLVANVRGRIDSRRCHIELATDRSGGRIRWGSAPGFEIEENTVEQKLAILRETYRQTGRADAHFPAIDISTFPDRFTVPG